MNLSDNAVALIRTYTPALVGLVAGWAVAAGLPVSQGMTDALTPVLSGAFIAAYYAGARYLEHRWPAFGWLLGVAKTPAYGAKGSGGHGKVGWSGAHTPTQPVKLPGHGEGM